MVLYRFSKLFTNCFIKKIKKFTRNYELDLDGFLPDRVVGPAQIFALVFQTEFADIEQTLCHFRYPLAQHYRAQLLLFLPVPPVDQKEPNLIDRGVRSAPSV